MLKSYVFFEGLSPHKILRSYSSKLVALLSIQSHGPYVAISDGRKLKRTKVGT